MPTISSTWGRRAAAAAGPLLGPATPRNCTPEQVAQNPNSFTGQYLKPVLERAWKLQGTAPAPVPEEPGRPAPAEEKASAQPPRKRKKADKK